MNALKILVIIIGVALAVSAAGNVFLYNTNIVVENDKNIYASALDHLNTDYDAVVAERNNLKNTINNLVTERDTARTNEEVLQGQVNQLTSDVNALTVERNSLKEEVEWLIYERDRAVADVETFRTRWRVINHQENNDGSRITFSGMCINTGLEELRNLEFHVTGYDMTGELVIDLYVGEMVISSGYYYNYHETVEYSPLMLSEWDVELIHNVETEE